MGYYKSFKRYHASGKRKYARAKKWSNTPQTPLALARQAVQGVHYLKGLVNSELNKSDFGALTTPTNVTSQSLIHMTAVDQGDSDQTRTGNSIYVRSLNGTVAFEKNTSANATYIRFMIIKDTQQIGDTTPIISDVLESDWMSHLNSDTVGRFQILRSCYIHLNSDIPTRIKRFNLPMRHHIRFNGTAAGDIQKGGLYLLALSNEGTAIPNLRYNFRLSYHDN